MNHRGDFKETEELGKMRALLTAFTSRDTQPFLPLLDSLLLHLLAGLPKLMSLRMLLCSYYG